MNYTKGEWKLDNCGTAIFASNRLVANCGGYSLSQHETETLAENKTNAHLIASAPDIYEALKEIINSETITSKDNFNKALKALAKAEGKE